jgi:hypothetical protein
VGIFSIARKLDRRCWLPKSSFRIAPQKANTLLAAGLGLRMGRLKKQSLKKVSF